MQTRKGQSIEDESMEIIEREVGSHPYTDMEWPIVRRIIHATAKSKKIPGQRNFPESTPHIKTPQSHS